MSFETFQTIERVRELQDARTMTDRELLLEAANAVQKARYGTIVRTARQLAEDDSIDLVDETWRAYQHGSRHADMLFKKHRVSTEYEGYTEVSAFDARTETLGNFAIMRTRPFMATERGAIGLPARYHLVIVNPQLCEAMSDLPDDDAHNELISFGEIALPAERCVTPLSTAKLIDGVANLMTVANDMPNVLTMRDVLDADR